MVDILHEAIKYLERYGNTREADLINYLTKVKHFPKRTVKAKISKATGKQLHRTIHPTKPPATYLTLRPTSDTNKHVPVEIQKELIRGEVELRKAEAHALAHGERH